MNLFSKCVVALVALILSAASTNGDYVEMNGRKVQHEYVEGPAPCGPKNPHLIRTPTTVADFEAHIVDSPEVVLLRVTDSDVLRDRQMGSSWEKLAITFKDTLSLAEFNLQERNDREMVRELGLQAPPFLQLYVGRRVARAAGVARASCDEDESDGACDNVKLANVATDAGPRTGSGGGMRSPDAGPIDLSGGQQDAADASQALATIEPMVVLVNGTAYSHGQVRQKIMSLVGGLKVDSNGRYLKRELQNDA